MQLKYHSDAFKLLGIEPERDLGAVASLDGVEAKLDQPLPASLREWYSCKNATHILERFSKSDHPVLPSKFELAQPRSISDYKRDVHYHGNTTFHLDSLLPPLRVFKSSVVFMYENQGACRWSVELDGCDDPPVIIEIDPDGSNSENAVFCVDRFSTFIECQLWDFSKVFGVTTTGKESKTLLVQSQDISLSMQDLKHLQHEFREQTRTFGWPGLLSFRFDCNHGHILLTVNPGQADWWIAANSAESLERLCEIVWRCGELSKSLYCAYDNSPAARVLEKLRR